MDWIVGIQKAIDYIENHLTEKIDYDMVAAQSFSSSYHFQRVFSILCGFTIGEYIRNRRLSLAGSELATTDAKVIDVALIMAMKVRTALQKHLSNSTVCYRLKLKIMVTY